MKILEQKIESLLFFKNEPLSFSWLSKILQTPLEVIKETILCMYPYYENRGISLVVTKESAALMTGEVSSDIIREMKGTKDERDLSKQAMETLSIIVYKEKVTKPEIDYIRGVNSVFILRNLLIRGLINKKQNTIDRRSPFYVPTHDLMSFLGIANIKDLPHFATVGEKIREIDREFQKEESEVKETKLEINHDIRSHSDDDVDND
jgi:segregation and condensation protein B